MDRRNRDVNCVGNRKRLHDYQPVLTKGFGFRNRNDYWTVGLRDTGMASVLTPE